MSRSGWVVVLCAVLVGIGGTIHALGCDTALIVIDVQEAFVTEYGWDTTATGRDIVLAVADLLALARSAGIHIAFIRHLGSPLHTTAEDPRAQFPDAIAPLEGERVFPKTNPDAFSIDEFVSFLESEQVGRLLVCGIASECVHVTLTTAHLRGYEVIAIADAHATEDGTQEGAASVNEFWRDTRKMVTPMAEVPWDTYDCSGD